MTRHMLQIDCDICTEAQATRLARYHAGLLLCRGCYSEEPKPDWIVFEEASDIPVGTWDIATKPDEPGEDDQGWYENEEAEENDENEEDDWQEDEEEWKWEEYG